MKQYLYADGVANVSLAGGMVRLDLFHYDGAPAEGASELPKVVDSQLVMPPESFIRAFESMQRFIDQLEKNGLIKRESAPKPQTVVSSVSPNFE